MELRFLDSARLLHAYAMDLDFDERNNGTTITLGRAQFETQKKNVTILDAPGHKAYLSEMISGASQADLAVLVISARKGELEAGLQGGATKEHSMLAKTAGIKHLIILVNKMDDPTVNWSEIRFIEIMETMTLFLRRCGFHPQNDLTFIPCSGLTGAFIKERPT